MEAGRELGQIPEYEHEILPLFRAGRYAEAGIQFERLLESGVGELSARARATLHANSIVAASEVRVRGGVLERGAATRLEGHLQAYLELLHEGSAWSLQPTRALFEALLRLWLADGALQLDRLLALGRVLPPRFAPTLPEALRAVFFEASAEARPLSSLQALGEAFLASSGSAPELRGSRVAVLRRLADARYVADQGEPGEAALAALALLDRALAEDPGDASCRRLRELIEQRMAVVLQIARFQHDTASRVGALFDAMEQLRDEAPALSAKARQALRVIERNLRAITAVGAVVRKEAPVREAWASLDPARLAREVVAQLGLPEACVRVEGKPQLWELARDYVALALDNLLRNAIEAYARRGLPVPEPPVEVCVRYGCGEIRVRDRAGGIDPKLGDIFLPYVSEKGIRQNAGLGLTQAREALDLVGGRLELAGVQPEGGAEFVMTM